MFSLLSSVVICGAIGCRRTNKDTKLSVCSQCKTTRYCSRKCQLADWKSHKKYCTADVAIADPPTEDRTPMQLLQAQMDIGKLHALAWKMRKQLGECAMCITCQKVWDGTTPPEIVAVPRHKMIEIFPEDVLRTMPPADPDDGYWVAVIVRNEAGDVVPPGANFRLRYPMSHSELDELLKMYVNSRISAKTVT